MNLTLEQSGFKKNENDETKLLLNENLFKIFRNTKDEEFDEYFGCISIEKYFFWISELNLHNCLFLKLRDLKNKTKLIHEFIEFNFQKFELEFFSIFYSILDSNEEDGNFYEEEIIKFCDLFYQYEFRNSIELCFLFEKFVLFFRKHSENLKEKEILFDFNVHILNLIIEIDEINFEVKFIFEAIEFYEFNKKLSTKLIKLNEFIDIDIDNSEFDFDSFLDEIDYFDFEPEKPKDEEIYSTLQLSQNIFLLQKKFKNFQEFIKLLANEPLEIQKYYISYSMNTLFNEHSMDQYLRFTNGKGEEFKENLFIYLNSISNDQSEKKDHFILFFWNPVEFLSYLIHKSISLKNQFQNTNILNMTKSIIQELPSIEYDKNPLLLISIQRILKTYSNLNYSSLFQFISTLKDSIENEKWIDYFLFSSLDVIDELFIKLLFNFKTDLKLNINQEFSFFIKLLHLNDRASICFSEEFALFLSSEISKYSILFSTKEISEQLRFKTMLRISPMIKNSILWESNHLLENLVLLSYIAANSNSIQEFENLNKKFSPNLKLKIEKEILDINFSFYLKTSMVQVLPFLLENELKNYFKYFLIPLSFDYSTNENQFLIERIIIILFNSLECYNEKEFEFLEINAKIFNFQNVQVKIPSKMNVTQKIFNLINVILKII
eukprot:gene8026-12491_t